MPTDPAAPSVEDVQRIAAIDNPVIRNLQITQCYAELSATFAGITGLQANWCTFATWASKQAGQTIRKEDLERFFESRLRSEPRNVRAAEYLAASTTMFGVKPVADIRLAALDVRNFSGAIENASRAVSLGNKKVFEEIGLEFARFIHTCLATAPPDNQSVQTFCDQLRAGDPPEGQMYLRQAFAHYAQAIGESNPQIRAQLTLLANLEIGYHEQVRLQPEIAASLDAGFESSLQVTRSLIAILPMMGWLTLADLFVRRLLKRPTRLDLAVRSLLASVQIYLRRVITEIMMTISLPDGVQLRLGRDLEVSFPDSLLHITLPDLGQLLEKIDPTPDSLLDSGALDWADLPDRLHFIADLFRCYQEYMGLFALPFTPEQVQALKAGRLPAGPL